MTPTFVLTAVLDVLDLEAGGRETGLRFTCAQTGDYFDMPITPDQLDQVIGAVASVQQKVAEPAPPAPPPPDAPPAAGTLDGRGAVDMEPLEHEDPDMEVEDDEDEPIVLRTPRFTPPAQQHDEDPL